MNAVVLLSGGVDSATTLAIAKSRGYKIYALTVNYGQKHSKEIKCAKKIGKYFKVAQHKIFQLNLAQFGGSALTDKKIKIPVKQEFISSKSEIPLTYVPARNTILLGIATCWAEVIAANAIFIGANAIDYSGYPDCRPQFIESFQKVISVGTKSGAEGKEIKIIAPIINMKKSEIIRKGLQLGVPFELTWSCYRGEKKACGVCDSCKIRLKGFSEVGIPDPIEYEKQS
ncbi:MAG: 7-cyano-7-deazaguanine synthase QueC [Elusimicrobiota bacterium]|nr:7-cyano-7-deazaguanine synthase QueC [Elusimicrobiota bacterium]